MSGSTQRTGALLFLKILTLYISLSTILAFPFAALEPFMTLGKGTESV